MPIKQAFLILGIGVGAFKALIGVEEGSPSCSCNNHILWVFEQAVGTSLFVIFLDALSETLAYIKQKRINIKIRLMFTALTILSAILGVYMLC